MPRTPRVSVVVAAYNAARYVGATIRSVLAQTFQDFDVVVVDDGSTDGTAEVVAAISDPRIRLLRQANAGPAAARNCGIFQSTGAYVAIVDADDQWTPTKLAEQVALLEAQPRVGACFTHLEVIDPDDRSLAGTLEEAWFNVPPPESAVALAELLATRNRLAQSSALLRRAAVESVGGYDVDFVAVEDFDLWLRLLHTWDVAVIPKPLTRYRVHPTSLTSATAHSYRMLQMALIVQRALASLPLERIYPWLNQPYATPAERDEAYARAHLALAGQLQSSGFVELLPAALDQLHRARALAPALVSREMIQQLAQARTQALTLNSLDAFSWRTVLERGWARLRAGPSGWTARLAGRGRRRG